VEYLELPGKHMNMETDMKVAFANYASKVDTGTL